MLRIILTLLAIIYSLWPVDVLNDFIPGVGWLDDMVILWLLWRYFYAPGAPWGSARRSGPSASDGQQQQGAAPDDPHSPPVFDPYTVLGVSRGASTDEIKQAYRKLAAQYHPDKVAHLGREFQDLAEKRFKEIQQAYQQIGH